ncbi:MAG: crotonase/enoyl-CoA hydratase family protein [Solirubrobacterales bacterium]
MSPLFEHQVRYERRGACAVVTIDRPERRNAVDGPTADALDDAYDRWVADQEAKVMILTGAGGKAFCAGADLKAIETFEPRIAAEGGPLGFTRRIPPKPAIAAIEGWCLAGGMELALWCDIRIGAASARFGFTERRFGVPLIDGATQRLPRIVGLGRAMDLVLTGRVIDVEEGCEIGLVNEQVADGSALERALELGEQLAAFPWPTLLADRESTLEAQGFPLPEGMAREAARGTGTVLEGVSGAARFAAGEGRHGSGVDGTS